MSTFSRRNFLAMSAGMATLAGFPLFGQQSMVAVNDTGVALDGYDTTAYWTVGRPLSGFASHTVEWRGTPWHFATAQDAAAFEATPDVFAPKFGGFCTRAMSFKKIVNGDPEVWRIYQGSLYLFAKPVGGRKFDKGQDAMIAKAQAHWDTLG